MKTIDQEFIQLIFSQAIFKRGYSYYKKNRVKDISYDRNHDVWNGVVAGSESYFIEVKINDLAKLDVSHYCDCPAHEAYGECKHVVAVLLQISDSAKQRDKQVFNQFDYDRTRRFMESLSSVRQDFEEDIGGLEREPMAVEYILQWTFNKHLYIELKTGVTHRYVVKDVKTFLQNVLNGVEHEFTKRFMYHPENHYFQKEDLEIFEYLDEVIRNEEVYEHSGFQYYSQELNEARYKILPPLLAKEMITKLSDRDLTVISDLDEYQNVSIEENALPFEFELAKTGQNDLVFSLGDVDDFSYFENYGILFKSGVFYFLDKDKQAILWEMTHLGIGVKELPIAKDQADLFLSEVIPSLKQVGDVAIADNVKEEIIHQPLVAKLYLEMKAGFIHGNLEYHYGDIVINPFQMSGNRDKMILRDVDKEARIMRLIEHGNFHYNGTNLYIDAEEADLFNFLYHVLPLLEEDVELFMTSDLRNFVIERDVEPQTNIEVDEASNLLDIGFNISGIDEEEIQAILAAVIEKKRYYRMNSGAFLSLENEGFQNVQNFFNEMDINAKDAVDGHVQMPIYRGAEVDELIDTKKVYDVSFRKLLHHLRAPEEQVYELPDAIEAELRPYQNTGYQWFKSLSSYHLGGILADDMGLGKTLQSIAYITSEQHGKPHLIVAPSSVVYNWKNECEKFAPSLKVAVLTGTPQERKERIESEQAADVWITSYTTLRQDIEEYRDLTFQTLILDEAQYIKNYRTKTSRAIREIVASRKFALSGTPIENSIDELWAIFQVILPGLMPNQKEFKQLSHEKIARMTQPFILRRLKQEVLTELPEKIESVHISELTKEQKDLYVGYLNQLRQEAVSSLQAGSFKENRMKMLAGLTRLRQICCHPSLFMENYTGTSGKLEQLLEMIDQFMEQGNRMLIFSQFTSMHEILIRILEEKGIEYFYLHGGTPSNERVEMCDRFNNGEKSIFLISLKAGGTGLNLTGADTVIMYDLWWNPAVEDQATGRAHRFGQKKVVQVIRLIAEGTIEEKIYELQQKKRELIDTVIQPGEKMLTGLSEDDIKELLNI